MASKGRPTDYDTKYCEELLAYFNIEPHFETPVEKQDRKGNVTTSIRFIASDLPTLAGFAQKIGVHRDTLNEWSNIHEDFSDAIKKAKECQEHILITNALKSNYNPAFSIFFAKNNMNWKDKTETDILSGGKPIYNQLNDEQLTQLIKDKARKVGIVESDTGEGKEN